MNNEEKILSMLETLTSDVSEMKTDIVGLKTDVAGLKTDVAGLKTDVARIAQTQKKHEGYLLLSANLLQSMDARIDALDPHLAVFRDKGELL